MHAMLPQAVFFFYVFIDRFHAFVHLLTCDNYDCIHFLISGERNFGIKNKGKEEKKTSILTVSVRRRRSFECRQQLPVPVSVDQFSFLLVSLMYVLILVFSSSFSFRFFFYLRLFSRR